MKMFSIILVVMIAVWIAPSEVYAQKKAATHRTSKAVSNGLGETKDMLSMLQGRWSSLDDKKTFFQIEGDRQIDIYGRDILDTGTVNFYDECPQRITADDKKRRSGKYLTVELRPNDFYCYSIEKISPQQLVLMYLPKGSILRYKKVPTINLEAGGEDH